MESLKDITTENTEITEENNSCIEFEYYEIAGIQIERAIELYSDQQDYICATTLAYAADGLLSDIIKKNDKTSSTAHEITKTMQGEKDLKLTLIPKSFKHLKEETCDIEHDIKATAENAIYLAIVNFSIATQKHLTEKMQIFSKHFLNPSSVISVPSVVKPYSSEDINTLSGKVVDCAIHVHKQLGPGLLESAYQQALAYMLTQKSIPFIKERTIPVKFENINIDAGYRADFVIDNQVIVELKSVDKLAPIHEAQLLTYMKLGNFPLGLLLNFNERLLKDGIKRMRL